MAGFLASPKVSLKRGSTRDIEAETGKDITTPNKNEKPK
jgi:hypothetical protein